MNSLEQSIVKPCFPLGVKVGVAVAQAPRSETVSSRNTQRVIRMCYLPLCFNAVLPMPPNVLVNGGRARWFRLARPLSLVRSTYSCASFAHTFINEIVSLNLCDADDVV